MSERMMEAMIVLYVVLAFVAGLEGRVGLALYWLGASVLTAGLLVGMK